MKVLSIQQPWASLIMMNEKFIETRGWNTNHRGPLLIHASAGKDRVARDLCANNPHFKRLIPDYNELPFGAITGSVNLVDSVQMFVEKDGLPYPEVFSDLPVERGLQEIEFGDYTAGRYGWLMENPVVFERPIPAKGQLRLWDYIIDPSLICNH